MKKGNKDLTDQPLTSSIWGKRMNQIANEYLDKVPVKIHDPEFKYLKSFGIKIKDKWYRELYWTVRENLCEILVVLASLVCTYFIIKAWICHLS